MLLTALLILTAPIWLPLALVLTPRCALPAAAALALVGLALCYWFASRPVAMSDAGLGDDLPPRCCG